MIKFAKPHTIHTGSDCSFFNQLPMSNLININAGKSNGEAIEKVGIIAAIAAFAGTAVAWVGKWFNKKKEGENKQAAILAEKNAKIEIMREESKIKIEQLDKAHEIWEKEQDRKLQDFIEKEKVKNSTPTQGEEPFTDVAPQANNSQPVSPDIPDARFSKKRIVPTNFVVPRLISEGEIATIYGHEKIGKSYLGAQIAKDSALGGASSLFPKEGILVPKCDVFYYSAENWKDDVSTRLPDGFLDEYKYNFHLLEVDGYDVAKLMELINYQILNHSGFLPILVIIDNLSGIVDNVYSGEVDTLMSDLISLKKDADSRSLSLTIILFAHDKADKDLASAQSVGRKVSTIIRFAESEKNDDERIIEIVRSNLHKKDKFFLRFKEETKLHFEHVDKAEEESCNTKIDESEDGVSITKRPWTDVDDAKLQELVRQGLHADEIAEIMDRKEALIGRHAKSLGITITQRKPGRKPKQ